MTKTFCDKCDCEITDENKLKALEMNMKRGAYELLIDFNISMPERRHQRDKVPEDHHICFNCIVDLYNQNDKRPKVSEAPPPSIVLTDAEVSSRHNRQKWAEGLIRQLPSHHSGRNSWLLNFGNFDEADQLRKEWTDGGGATLGWSDETQSSRINVKHGVTEATPRT